MAYIMVSPRTYNMGDALIPFDKLTHGPTATTLYFNYSFILLYSWELLTIKITRNNYMEKENKSTIVQYVAYG